jgi:hypothetical protein
MPRFEVHLDFRMFIDDPKWDTLLAEFKKQGYKPSVARWKLNHAFYHVSSRVSTVVSFVAR